MSHTPGPWINDETLGVTYSPDGRPIMTAGSGCVTPSAKEGQANARLIAAAPDLLAACAHMLATWGSDDEDEIIACRDAAREAITKATKGA